MLALKREGNAQVQTEIVEIIALPYLSSKKKLKIWSFHVVVVHGRRRNVEKRRRLTEMSERDAIEFPVHP